MSSIRLVVAAAVCSLGLVASTEAAIISVTDEMGNSTISIVEGTTSVDVYVRIRAEALETPTTISAASVRFFVGDGGPVNSASDIVPITAVQFTGTGTDENESIWETVSGDLDDLVLPALPSSSFALLDVNIDLPNTNVNYFLPGMTASVLAVVTLDTSSLMAGDSDSLGTLGGFLIDVGNAGAPTTAQRILGGGNASVPINVFETALLQVTAIPEPGSFVLLSFGAASVVAGRRWRRRRQAGKQAEE